MILYSIANYHEPQYLAMQALTYILSPDFTLSTILLSFILFLLSFLLLFLFIIYYFFF